MKKVNLICLFSSAFLLILAFVFAAWHLDLTKAQNRPLTYPEIFTALNTPIPNQSFKTKIDLINFLIAQVKARKVDKPLTKDREEDLRQTVATEQLIAAIRENSPPIPTPIPSFPLIYFGKLSIERICNLWTKFMNSKTSNLNGTKKNMLLI